MKIQKFWPSIKIVRLIAFLILFYQIISLTISYLEYESVIDMKATFDIENKPMITFCLKNDFEFPKKFQNIVYKKVYDNPIGCSVKNITSWTEKLYNCSNLTQIIESVTPFSQRCRSYFSQLLDNDSYFGPTHNLMYNIDNNVNLFGLIHQKKTPPHFSRQKIEILKSTHHIIDYIRSVAKLLPFPYSTDCYNYISEEKSVVSYKSKEDCIVKHLEREEFKFCGCNKRWNYRAFGDKNSSNICPKSLECKFDAKSEIKSLEKICKNDCLIEYYMNVFVDQKSNARNPKRNTKLVSIITTRKFETLFTYLPKMNLVDYFCSIGGLISMWFGISVYDLIVIFAKESQKKIIHFFGQMNHQIFILAIIKFNAFVSTFTIIFFSTLMFIQIIAIISSYFDYEIVTRFEVQEIKLIPNIELTFLEKTKNLNKLIEIYPELKQEIHEFEKSGINVSHMNLAQDFKFRPIYWKYLMRLIADNRLNDFHRILETKKLIKSCQIKINNELELINCTQGDFGISTRIHFKNCLIKYLNFSGLMNKKKIEKVTFVFNNFMVYQGVRLFLCITGVGPNFRTTIESNKKTTITFSSFSVKRLRFDENDCIPEEIEKDFGENYFEFCLFDCLIDSYNQSFGCISNSFPHFYFNRHLLKFNYKLCNTFT